MAEHLDLARRVAAEAAAGEEVEAFVSWARRTNVRVYQGEIESLSTAEPAGIGVRVIKDGRVGFSYAGALTEDVAEVALAEARDNRAFATEDPYTGLVEPDGVTRADLGLWSERLVTASTDEKIDLALEMDRLAHGTDERIRQVDSSDYEDYLVVSAIATSTGIEAEQRRSSCYLFSSVVAGTRDDTATGSGHSAGRDLSDLDPERAATTAVERAVRMLSAKKPDSCRLPIILDKRVTATLLSILAGTLSGEEVAKGRSLFAGRVGEEVAAATLTLVDVPTDPAAFGASAFDGEGLSCRANRLIEGGKLTGYLHHSHSARVSGTASTASAVRGGFRSVPGVGARAVMLEPGDLGFEEILAKVGNGLYVQSVTGVHSGVNPVSGDFSVGAEGLMVRGGAFAEPVREVTIASTIQRMLQRVLAVGADLEWLPGSAAGLTLAVDDVSMSGN